MRYASIRELDISNGEGVGVALFVQGCHFHCYNCFNPDTWDFNGGKEWTPEVEDKFIELASRPYIKRISLLGGEPLADENLDGVLHLVDRFRLLFPQKSIWLYTGYTWEDILPGTRLSWFQGEKSENIINECIFQNKRAEIIEKCDILVDGRYIDSQRDVTLKWKGSKNQRVIDIQQSLQHNQIVLYCD